MLRVGGGEACPNPPPKPQPQGASSPQATATTATTGMIVEAEEEMGDDGEEVGDEMEKDDRDVEFGRGYWRRIW